MTVGGPGNFPVSGVGGPVLRGRSRDDTVGCECTENGEKYQNTLAHFDLHSGVIHTTLRLTH
jgi:hypothetical protein